MDSVKQHFIVDLSSNNNFLQMTGMQGDGYGVRYAEIELVQNGQKYEINPDEVNVDIMGTKPDTKEIWNMGEVTSDGYILIEITQQMLAIPGRGDYCIIVFDKEHNKQIKSFPFVLITIKAPYDPSYIESSDEFQRLIAAITDAEQSEEEAKEAAARAKVSETNAKISEEAAKVSENNAKTSEINAADWSDLSKSYAVGTDGEVREGDATDNSKYYSEQSQAFAEDSEEAMDSAYDYSEKSRSYAVGTNNEYRSDDETDNSKYYAKKSKDSYTSSVAVLNNVIIEGENAVQAIHDALDIDAPNFVMDLETGHLGYEGGRFTFEVKQSTGHLMWGLTV